MQILTSRFSREKAKHVFYHLNNVFCPKGCITTQNTQTRSPKSAHYFQNQKNHQHSKSRKREEITDFLRKLLWTLDYTIPATMDVEAIYPNIYKKDKLFGYLKHHHWQDKNTMDTRFWDFLLSPNDCIFDSSARQVYNCLYIPTQFKIATYIPTSRDDNTTTQRWEPNLVKSASTFTTTISLHVYTTSPTMLLLLDSYPLRYAIMCQQCPSTRDKLARLWAK